jgi:hypothetical protein
MSERERVCVCVPRDHVCASLSLSLSLSLSCVYVKYVRVHTCGESGLMHIHTIGDLVSERYGLKGLGQWPPSGLAHSR